MVVLIFLPQFWLEQLERLHSENHRQPMITNTSDSHQIPSQNKTKWQIKKKNV